MKGLVIAGTTFILVSLAFVRSTNGQCSLSLTFPPVEESTRTIRITKVTTSLIVRVNIQCTGLLPTNNIDTTITYTDPNNLVTSTNPVTVTVFAGSIFTETTISLTDSSATTMTQTFTVTLTTSSAAAAVTSTLSQLVFSVENIAEISFDTSNTYQGQFGDTVTVSLIRTGAQSEITFNVEALNGSPFVNTPVQGTFAANSNTASVDIMITGDATTDTAVTLVINSIPANAIVTRNSSQRATLTVLRPVVLSTATTTIRISSRSSFVVFLVTASRSFSSDITINLSYSGDFTILVNRPSSIVLTSGATEVSENIMMNPTSTHTFAITMSSADNRATISSTNSFTTYIVEPSNVVISVEQTAYSAVEGSEILVTFTTDQPAPEEIEIDLNTPVASHASQLGPLPTAVILAQATRSAVIIRILDDSLSEGTQTVMVSLTSLTAGAVIESGDETITITISDVTAGDDPVISIPTNDDSNTDSNDGNGLSGGAAAGIAIGSVSFFILILGTAICCGLFVMSNGCGPTSPYELSPYPQRVVYPGRYPVYPSPVIYEVEY